LRTNFPPTVAIIGAGLSGLVCARTLQEAGFRVTVFEKSRGVGGRMATRRAEANLQFDHGAQYFTARDQRFLHDVASWIRSGLVAPWHGRICVINRGAREPAKKSERFVSVPAMTAVCKHLASDLNVQLQTLVAPPSRDESTWRLRDERGKELGKFDFVAVSAPAPQAAQLLQAAPDLADRAGRVLMHGCWAGMVAFDSPLSVEFDAAFVRQSVLSWVARNNSKPGRNAGHEAWVLHASPTWTQQHIDSDPVDILPVLLGAFWEATGLDAPSPQWATAHRWRYALPDEPLVDRCLFDVALGIGASGDWCAGPRVEGAYLSGLALAERFLESATDRVTQDGPVVGE
jgi:predicted NAD/FAD-dependent oxidoreductase